MSYPCNAETPEGIPYSTVLYSQKGNKGFEYKRIITRLSSLVGQIDAVDSGKGNVTQYSLGSRSVTRAAFNTDEMQVLWDKLWARKLQLEGAGSPRKAVAAVPRDW